MHRCAGVLACGTPWLHFPPCAALIVSMLMPAEMLSASLASAASIQNLETLVLTNNKIAEMRVGWGGVRGGLGWLPSMPMDLSSSKGCSSSGTHKDMQRMPSQCSHALTRPVGTLHIAVTLTPSFTPTLAPTTQRNTTLNTPSPTGPGPAVRPASLDHALTCWQPSGTQKGVQVSRASRGGKHLKLHEGAAPCAAA